MPYHSNAAIQDALVRIEHKASVVRLAWARVWREQRDGAIRDIVAEMARTDLDLLRATWRMLVSKPFVPGVKHGLHVVGPMAHVVGERSVDESLTRLDMLRENHELRRRDPDSPTGWDDLQVGGPSGQMRLAEWSVATIHATTRDGRERQWRAARERELEPNELRDDQRPVSDEGGWEIAMRKQSTHRKPHRVRVEDALRDRDEHIAAHDLVEDTVYLGVELLHVAGRYDDACVLEDAWVADGVLLADLLPDDCVIDSCVCDEAEASPRPPRRRRADKTTRAQRRAHLKALQAERRRTWLS